MICHQVGVEPSCISRARSPLILDPQHSHHPRQNPTLLHVANNQHSKMKHQRMICEYLGLTCTHLRTIFCLPRALRFRIYYEAGLIKGSDNDLNGQPEDDSSIWSIDTVYWSFSHSLLLSCRAIYTEVSSAVYSTNRFFLRYQDFGSLQPLRNLTPQSLSVLTHLTVHLNVSSCERGKPCCKVQPENPDGPDHHDKPLRLSPSSCHPILSEWQHTVECIKPHLKPGRLHLQVVCDVVDIETARQTALPLLSIPTLASCSIRLSQTPDPLIRQLARTTAMRAMGYPFYQFESPFRILDLPMELRRQIFEYTDLVTPLCEIEWTPLQGFSLRYSTWRCGGVGNCEPHLHHACQFRNCWEGSNDGCFCRHFHGAFTSKCHCWSPPTSLFLVCRGLLEDARAVFFRRNRFVIIHSQDFLKHAPKRLEVSMFLRDIVPLNALHLLRHLELVSPLVLDDHQRLEDEQLYFHDSPHQDWMQTIDLVKEKLCLPLLTVRFYMTDYGSDSEGNQRLKKAFHSFSRILLPLSLLKGLKAFFVHLAWPFARRMERRMEHSSFLRSTLELIQMSEQNLEQLVMVSNYDSTASQKEQLRKSQWLEIALKSIEPL